MPIVDGYLRPMNRRELWTPDAALRQRRQISVCAHERGWEISQLFEEQLSSEEDPGPLLRLALDRVESRESDGIVATSVTALGASLADALGSIERIQAAGGAFVSVTDGLDLGHQEGRKMLRLLLSVVSW